MLLFRLRVTQTRFIFSDKVAIPDTLSNEMTWPAVTTVPQSHQSESETTRLSVSPRSSFVQRIISLITEWQSVLVLLQRFLLKGLQLIIHIHIQVQSIKLPLIVQEIFPKITEIPFQVSEFVMKMFPN